MTICCVFQTIIWVSLENKNISFGQMSLEEKNKIAHRARAVNKLISYLTNLY